MSYYFFLGGGPKIKANNIDSIGCRVSPFTTPTEKKFLFLRFIVGTVILHIHEIVVLHDKHLLGFLNIKPFDLANYFSSDYFQRSWSWRLSWQTFSYRTGRQSTMGQRCGKIERNYTGLKRKTGQWRVPQLDGYHDLGYKCFSRESWMCNHLW